MLLTIEKLAESLRSSLKQAVSPVGQTCRSIDIIPSPESGAQPISIDQATKDAILADDDDAELTGLKSFVVIITEMDRERGTAKVRLLGQDGEPEADDDGTSRVNAKITDPAFESSANVYIQHFASGEKLEVRGKASIKEGVIRQLYLSDAG